jgi:hypothetical protein
VKYLIRGISACGSKTLTIIYSKTLGISVLASSATSCPRGILNDIEWANGDVKEKKKKE